MTTPPTYDSAAALAAATTALGRAALCRALARALDYPGSTTRTEVAARLAMVLDSRAVAWPDGVHPGVTAIAMAFATEGDALEAEHVRLFGPSGAAPPVETAWGDAGRLLGKAATLADLGGFYRAFGVQPSARVPRPEDHLAVELEFLAVLALKEAWAVTHGLQEAGLVTRDAAGAFLRDHLGCWTDAWCSTVVASARLPAYAGLAEAIAALVAAECRRAGVVPHAVRARLHDRSCGPDGFRCPLAGDGAPSWPDGMPLARED